MDFAFWLFCGVYCWFYFGGLWVEYQMHQLDLMMGRHEVL